MRSFCESWREKERDCVRYILSKLGSAPCGVERLLRSAYFAVPPATIQKPGIDRILNAYKYLFTK